MTPQNFVRQRQVNHAWWCCATWRSSGRTEFWTSPHRTQGAETASPTWSVRKFPRAVWQSFRWVRCAPVGVPGKSTPGWMLRNDLADML